MCAATLCCAVEQVDQHAATADSEEAYRQLLVHVPTFQSSRTTEITKSPWTIAPQYALIRVWPRHWARLNAVLFPADPADPDRADSDSGASMLFRNGVLRRPVLCRFTSTCICFRSWIERATLIEHSPGQI